MNVALTTRARAQRELTATATARPRGGRRISPYVYISNPMRVRTSESEFLALVQKRTGWDSDVATKMNKYCDPMIESVPKEFNSTESTTSTAKQEEDQVIGVEMYESIVNPFDMSEDILRFMSSSLIYDPQGDSMQGWSK